MTLVTFGCAVGATREGMNRRALIEVVAIPVLAAAQIALVGGWLLDRGRPGVEIVPSDQTVLSIALLAIVGDVLLFQRWKEAITRENGMLRLPASLLRWGYVGLNNLKAWGVSLSASLFLLMTISQEGVLYALLAFGALIIGQVMWWVLALAAMRGSRA